MEKDTVGCTVGRSSHQHESCRFCFQQENTFFFLFFLRRRYKYTIMGHGGMAFCPLLPRACEVSPPPLYRKALYTSAYLCSPPNDLLNWRPLRFAALCNMQQQWCSFSILSSVFTAVPLVILHLKLS
ncbi:hypothetical protein, unlikely [Trypanosoma brucei gambiense DAL972]|uniref:Uncharacterized protein n=1 Tax=Trypanosoma brucei gambiense (strain MHOM/CI/86/DAL972) TaxID=679716 RepID=C9ZP22_TRYB9|nr:hypothetical protein, unlikely [Trypanosoma brucei gambiense DAL972]CBH11150.1 hypothetical protein, unlikely [Trypanosoma brucei gambiense DAL972]|eukprot:XP_011773437.1 hypothetical protein, unlikely [Trypanosoma brucei gambiense DAL972]